MLSGKTIATGIAYAACMVLGVYTGQKFKAGVSADIKMSEKAGKGKDTRRFHLVGKGTDENTPHPIFKKK